MELTKKRQGLSSQMKQKKKKKSNLDFSIPPPHMLTGVTKEQQKEWLHDASGQMLQRQTSASPSTDQGISGKFLVSFSVAQKRKHA